FTAEPVEASLAFWTKELGLPAKFEFAAYNQVFQQLLDPSSLLMKNQDGFNIILLRLTDWQRFEENVSASDAKKKIEQSVRELAGIVRSVQRSSTPTLVCLCPPEANYAGDPEWSTFLPRMEETLASELST